MSRQGAEIDRQVANLHDLGYAEMAGITGDELDALLEPAVTFVQQTRVAADGSLPFLLVVSSTLVPTVEAVRRWTSRGRCGFTDMAAELPDYRPVTGVEVPRLEIYALLDVDTGAESLDVRPNDALPMILGAGRTPLTIDEGVALVTHHPDVFTTHNAFQALGSRARDKPHDKRVPTFWISRGAPRLGWCWAGNPHTWLGAASAAARQGSG